MKYLFLFVLLSSCLSHAEKTNLFPVGRWEGFQKNGHFNSAIIMSIDENGRGFYGYSLGGKGEGATCFPVNESTLTRKIGYYEQYNKVKEEEFVLLFSEGLANSLEGMSIFVYDKQAGSIPFSWSFIFTKEEFINLSLKKACDEKLKSESEIGGKDSKRN